MHGQQSHKKEHFFFLTVIKSERTIEIFPCEVLVFHIDKASIDSVINIFRKNSQYSVNGNFFFFFFVLAGCHLCSKHNLIALRHRIYIYIFLDNNFEHNSLYSIYFAYRLYRYIIYRGRFARQQQRAHHTTIIQQHI